MGTKEKVNVEKEIGKELIKIKENYENNTDFEFLRRGYLTSNFVTKHRVLMIGMNPSWQNDERNAKLDNATVTFEDVEVLIKKDHHLRYFGRFKELFKKIKSHDWTHFDLLYCRETQQKEVVRFIAKNNSYLTEQLKLSKSIIEKSKPKIIVVANALACKYFLKNENLYSDKMKFDNDIGTYRIIDPASNNFDTPVFFTGMISGQRALDNGSFQRLEWHITQVLKKLAK